MFNLDNSEGKGVNSVPLMWCTSARRNHEEM